MKHDVVTEPAFQKHETVIFAHRRAAIDLVATTRARAVRSALFGSYLFRTNPLGPEDDATRQKWREILREQYDGIARACALVTNSGEIHGVPREVAAWIGAHGKQHPTQTAAFVTMRDLTRRVVDAAERDDPKSMQLALNNHFEFGRGTFFETVTKFCDGLWADLDTSRHAEVEKAHVTAATIAQTLARLEHIGKHVRLVSLNASVEASRVGDAGRGLGVIAVEFKTLAEEIQMLATTARRDISSMTSATDD